MFRVIMSFALLFLCQSSLYAAPSQSEREGVKACILSSSLPGWQVSTLAESIYQLNTVQQTHHFSVVICYFPQIPDSVTALDFSRLEAKGLVVSVVDNNKLAALGEEASYDVIVGMRVLCTCLSTSLDFTFDSDSHKRLFFRNFLKSHKTCGGIQQSLLLEFLGSVEKLLKKDGIALLSGQSSLQLEVLSHRSREYRDLIEKTRKRLSYLLHTYRSDNQEFVPKVFAPQLFSPIALCLKGENEIKVSSVFFLLKLILPYQKITTSLREEVRQFLVQGFMETE